MINHNLQPCPVSTVEHFSTGLGILIVYTEVIGFTANQSKSNKSRKIYNFTPSIYTHNRAIKLLLEKL